MTEPLYKIADRWLEFAKLVADDPELDLDAVADTLESIDAEFNSKAEAIGSLILNLEASAKARTEAAKRILDLAKSEQRKAAWMRDYLAAQMRVLGKRSIGTDEWTAKFKLNPEKLVIDDETKIPACFLEEAVVKEIKNAEIKAFLKDGGKLEGAAHLTRTERLEIK